MQRFLFELLVLLAHLDELGQFVVPLFEQYIDICPSFGDIVLECHQAVVEHDTVDENNGQQAEEDHVAGGHSGFPCYDLVVGGVWLGQVFLE